MSARTEATVNTLAALFVLFTAMLDPRISVGLAVVFLAALAVFKFASGSRGTVGS